ncbi:hypothetical protein ACN47E_006140 [Coniothyrium glycines]
MFEDWSEASEALPEDVAEWVQCTRARDKPRRDSSSLTRKEPANRKCSKTDADDSIKIPKLDNAVAVLMYNSVAPNPRANDVWPDCRSPCKLPARYVLLDKTTTSDQVSKNTPRHRSARSSEQNAAANHISPQDADERALGDNGRPEWKLPVELLELVTVHLNRDDIKSLRLVSRELNYFVSQVMFKTVVVPFNTEIYGMLVAEPKVDVKGKGRVRLKGPEYSWKNASGDDLYDGHGLDVFRGFGKHIRRFGMSFEVREESLAMPPAKSLTETKTSFWGDYDWPFEEYRRFDTVAGLETAADETPRMKVAFSELTKVKELALSIDNGLGWLNGPDKSLRSRIFQRPLQVFGSSKGAPDRKSEAQHELWTYLRKCHRDASGEGSITHAMLYRTESQRTATEPNETILLTKEQPKMAFLDSRLINEAIPHGAAEIPLPTSFDPDVLSRLVTTPSKSATGILFSGPINPNDVRQIMGPIVPACLTEAQKEWLLETEWAQRAFLSSYMLSVVDNVATFQFVHTLNISRLPSTYLHLLSRSDFWKALPSLSNLTLLVLPIWRAVCKDEAGFVDTSTIDPTSALSPFCSLIDDYIIPHPDITSLTIGWVTGGEHGEGLHARNRLLFPAPIWASSMLGDCTDTSYTSPMLLGHDLDFLKSQMLQFAHIKRLTLQNCWLTPPALRSFVDLHDAFALEHLVFDSVSLTAILRSPQPNAQAPLNNGPIQPILVAGVLWSVINGQGGAPAYAFAQAQAPNQQQVLQFYLTTLQTQLQQIQANIGNAAQQGQLQVLQNSINNQLQPLLVANNQPLQFPNQGAGQPTLPYNPLTQSNINLNHVIAIANQVQQQIQSLNGNGQAGQAAALFQPMDARTALRSPPREGSWMSVIDTISPGTNLSDFGSGYSKASRNRTTALQSVEFKSCGYAKLPHIPYDQSAIEAAQGTFATAIRNPIFSKRSTILAHAMLGAKWAHLGEIVQEVDPNELAALDAGWDLKTGWEDIEAAQAVESDGLLPGGTGRFTGIIRRSNGVDDSVTSAR